MVKINCKSGTKRVERAHVAGWHDKAGTVYGDMKSWLK
jgi:hypothetical protein